MAKQKAEALEAAVVDNVFYIKQEKNGIYKNHWIIYSKTKWGHKAFIFIILKKEHYRQSNITN